MIFFKKIFTLIQIFHRFHLSIQLLVTTKLLLSSPPAVVHVAALSTGVIGCELEGDAIIFCRTSRIFSCKQILVGNTSECLAQKRNHILNFYKLRKICEVSYLKGRGGLVGWAQAVLLEQLHDEGSAMIQSLAQVRSHIGRLSGGI